MSRGERIKVDSYLWPYIKVNSKMIKDLKLKCEMLKLDEKKKKTQSPTIYRCGNRLSEYNSICPGIQQWN